MCKVVWMEGNQNRLRSSSSMICVNRIMHMHIECNIMNLLMYRSETVAMSETEIPGWGLYRWITIAISSL